MSKLDKEKYINLVEHLLNLNADSADPNSINMAIARASVEREHLEGVEITPELNLKCDVGEQHILEAVASVVRITFDFLSAILEEDSLEEDFLSPLRSYISANSLDGILPLLKDIISQEDDADPLHGKTDTEKIAAIYQSCISSYLKESDRDYSKHLKGLFSSVADVKVHGKDVQVAPNKSGKEDMAGEMAKSFNEFLELFFSLEEKEIDLGVEKKKLKAILGQFGAAPKDLGITGAILFGSLASSVTTGLAPLDALLGGGIPRGESVVLRSPPGWEDEVVSRRFIRSSLLSGGSVIVVLSSMSCKDFFNQMVVMGLNVERYLENGKLRIVDWFSHNIHRIVGMERKGNIITCSHDLTNVNIALEEHLREMAGTPVKMGVVEIASPSLMRFGFEVTYEFVQAVNSKFKTADVSGIVVLVKGMHNREYMHSISEIFSNAIDMERLEGKTEGRLSFTASSVFSVKRSYLTASWTKRGLVIEGENMEVVPVLYEKDVLDLGIKGFEKVGSGIPVGRTTLILSHEGLEKDTLLESFARSRKKKSLVVVLGNMSPDEFTMGGDKNSSGMLFVDWFSHKNEKIIGVDREGDIFRSSQDISHLAIAIKQALSEAGEGCFVIVDVFTSLLRYYDLSVVFSFATSISAVLREVGATTIVPFDGEAFDAEYAAAFMNVFDATLQLREDRELEGVKLAWIPTVRNGFSTGKYAVCGVNEEGMVFEELEEFMEKKGTPTTKDQSMMVEVLKQENERLKREIAVLEETLSSSANDAGVASSESMESLKAQMEKDAHDVGEVLAVIDELFEKLSQNDIDEFMASEAFSLYERVVDRFALGGDRE